MRIGQVAERAGVNVETVRFYELKGLIDRPVRPRCGGFRDYPEECIHRIRFIRATQGLGFSLKEARELLTLESAPQTRCADIRTRALSKLGEVEEKITRLNQIRSTLSNLIDACPAEGPAGDCSILKEFKGAGS